ncbi:MAG: energy-coupling factor transporter ATPase [Lachnospiraceae bacterium]|nr:energy-coupling factor transporter ATPase [Lachnospiraceae bacterium]
MKLIDIKNLSFEYFRRDSEGNVEEMVEALQDVSLNVEPGEFIAIVGRNGSGKSTLAKHINALLMPGEGEVIVDGMDTRDEEVKLHIRQTAGMVFQNPDNQLVGNLVEEDVAFGPENIGIPSEQIRQRVDNALSATKMEKYRNQSPNHLSGGQKQRVAIAGVLAMEPKCIIFDEATAMLDPEGRRQTLEAAKRLQKDRGITVILITHHMDEVLAADRVFVMKDGRVTASGTPEQIFDREELLEECGLCLPELYRYLNFLIGQELISRQEAAGIRDAAALSALVCGKYSVEKQHGATALTEEKLELTESGLAEGILFNHVSYLYNRGFANEQVALKNVDLSIGRGEFIAVIGHTGSGKSTLIQHLNGLYLPTEGSVYFDGQDIAEKDFPLRKLRQKVGVVFQYPEHQLFAETVEKDVCFGPENMDISRVEAHKRAYEAIKAVGLPDTIYDTSPLMLSGGYKRRVAIAGIMAMHPDYLVLDEPTAGLDPVSAKALLSMLKGLQKEGVTIVMVSHSMEEAAEYADRIVVMDKGEVKMDGKVWEVFGRLEELEELGLNIPIGTRLINDLIKVRNDIDIQAVRQEDICGELLKLKTNTL